MRPGNGVAGSAQTEPANASLAGGVRVEGVSKSFGEGEERNLVLDNINLTIGRGEFISLIGPSGCGKSTLLKLVAGLIHADSGRITIDGKTTREASSAKAIGLVPQEPALLPWKNVLKNVELPIRINKKANEGRSLRDPVELLGQMGLSDALKRNPAQLSGGMQQRVAIARAYVFDPDVLLMDEPFSALDELNRDQQRMDLLDFWQSNKKSVLFVTHSVQEAVVLSDRIMVMSRNPGRIVEILNVDLPRPRSREIFDNPEFHRVEHKVQELLHTASMGGEVHA